MEKYSKKPTAFGWPQFLPALILALDRPERGIKAPMNSPFMRRVTPESFLSAVPVVFAHPL